MNRYITGTLNELVGKLTLNDKVLNHLEIMMLSRLLNGKAFTNIGTIKANDGGGRPTVIWKVDTEVAFWFENAVEAVVVDDVAKIA